MKRIVAVVVLVAVLFNCAPTLPHYKYKSAEKKEAIVISERVGETIDAEEGKQFGLFAEIEGFEEAGFFALEDGGYVVEMKVTGGEYAAINRDPYAVMVLESYLGNYELVSADRATFEGKWGILDYDTLGIPITVDELTTARKRIRQYACTWGAGGVLTTSLLGIGLGVAFVREQNLEPPDEVVIALIFAPIYIAAVSVAALLVGAGVYLGSSRTEEGVVKMIKEARKPRLVE